MQTIEDLKELQNQLVALRRDKTLPIYVVDSNFILKKLIKNLLMQMGFKNVEIGLSGLKTLTLLRSVSEPTLVIYSITNHELDGFKFIKELNQFKQDKPIKVVFLSNPLSMPEMEKIGDMGIDAFLFKPIDIKSLVHAMQISGMW